MLKTRSGWLGKVEVVELQYDPAVVSYDELTRLAKKNGCASIAFPMTDAELPIAKKHYSERVEKFAGKVRVVEDTKYYLKRTPFQYVPMTEAQAARVNGDVQRGEQWLSPAQRKLLSEARKKKPEWGVVFDKPILESWGKVSKSRPSASF